MFEAPPNNAYGAKFYETAAVSPALFGGDSEWLGEGCGKCWKVTGTANLGSYDSATISTLVLKGANLCPSENEACNGENVHSFDIAASGFDVSEFSLAQDCGALDPAEVDGYLGCGRWMIKDQDPTANCDCSAFSNPILRSGCENFRALNWDNPQVSYEEVNCPPELDRLNCWVKNGSKYPPFDDIPEFCVSNLDGGDEGNMCQDTSKKFEYNNSMMKTCK